MANNSYLNENGVAYLWSKIKSYIANASENYAGSISGDQNINVGVVPTEDGPKNYSLSLPVSSADASLIPGDTDVTIATIGATPIKLSLGSIGYYNAFRVSGSSGVELYSADEAGGNRFNIFAGNGIDIRDCGINEDGIYIDSTFDPDTKVSKSGDTMTGNLAIKKTVPVIICDNSSITIAANTSSFSAQHIGGFHNRDSNGQWISRLIGGVEPDARTATWVQVRNMKTDGTWVQGGITLHMNKSGTMSYSVTTPSAFRTALDLGNAATYDAAVIEDNSSGSVSVAKNTWKTMNTLTLTKGFYVIQLFAEWASAKGYSRQIILSTSKDSGSALGYRFKDFRSLYNNTSQCMNNVCFPLYVSATTTYYVNVNHNSDSAVNCVTRVGYFRLV